jgi:hypothetical protein
VGPRAGLDATSRPIPSPLLYRLSCHGSPSCRQPYSTHCTQLRPSSKASSFSRITPHILEPDGSLPCEEEPSRDPMYQFVSSKLEDYPLSPVSNVLFSIFTDILHIWVFSSPRRPDQFWGPRSLLSNANRVLFLWG